MITITKSSRTGSTIEIEQIFNEQHVHIKSRASYLLLKEKLMMADEDFLNKTKTLWDWLDFREIYLLKRKKENNGNLKCDYCGKEHLDIGGKKPEDLKANNRNKNLATIDHIEPLSDNGEKYNESNLAVACKKCNQKKANKSLREFVNSLKDKSKIHKKILKILQQEN